MSILLAFVLSASSNGVIIVDNVWFYGDDHRTRVLNAGDQVLIIEKNGDLIKSKYDNAIGELHKDVLINLDQDIGEDMLFLFAHGYFGTGEYPKAARLFDIFIQHFEGSKYSAEALYYDGLSYEGVAKNFIERNNFSNIILNKGSKEWYYSGKAYEKVLKKFPEGMYASKAAYRLIKISRIKNLPWNNSKQLIEEELRSWQDYVKRYEKREEYVLALLEIGYLNRVLFQITGKYPNSVHTAQAEVGLYEIENGIDAYCY
jgi:hypothetical protein